jgi:capsular exopolysaccharide synthesis family protein
VQVAEQHNNLRIIEPAIVPRVPVGPKRLLVILAGFLLSLAGGIGLAFFLEYLDNTVKSIEDVSRYAQLPTLAVIPAINASISAGERKNGHRKALATNGTAAARESKQGLVTALDTRSYDTYSLGIAAEAYRTLRTSVLLSTAGGPPKTILVTSGQPGEGKTTTTINTAISLAQLGASVLVIDADLRRPTTHKVLGVNQTAGLSTYLSSDTEVDKLITKLEIPNLSLLPCGPIPPNPSELISSEKMKQLLGALSQRFDHILIDSPPLIHVTDPVILSTMVDGVILVVRGGKSTRDVVRFARQELTRVGSKVFGVVLNSLDLKKEGYDYYYGYGGYSSYLQKGTGTNT